MNVQLKAVVSVSEMARMVGLSRARFYQLQRSGVFPAPLYDTESHRPFYSEDLQRLCLEVRRRNCGVNGKPVLFYVRGAGLKRSKTGPSAKHADLVDGIRSLGLTSVTAAQVSHAIQELFPDGTQSLDRAEVIRQVFIHLKRQNPGDKVR